MELNPIARSQPSLLLAGLLFATLAAACSAPGPRVLPASASESAGVEAPTREGSFEDLVELLAEGGSRSVAGVWSTGDGALPELYDSATEDPVRCRRY